ncbi:MAG: hypothetical protein VYB54_06605 [Pseudomonadota bacterium]|nr:hypothetical protein [Pseudomonadota bacterium]
MKYFPVAEAKERPGVKLALTANVPAPWSMSARTILELKGIDYTPVQQVGGGANEDLVAWTGHRNAPVLVVDGDMPRTGWLEILMWAERTAPEPRLVPADTADRAMMIGLANEICGEEGLAWCGRLFMLDLMVRKLGDAAKANPMLADYRYSADALEAALDRTGGILDLLAATLHAQKAKGSPYFVGDSMTALDIYWSFFSQLVDVLPDEICMTPVPLRKSWGAFPRAMEAAGRGFDPVLLEHRTHMLSKHLQNPMVF